MFQQTSAASTQAMPRERDLIAMIHRALAALAFGLIVTAGVTPALAQGSAQADYNGVARAVALRACSAREARYVDYLWGSIEVQIYRACMAGKGQQE